MFLLVLFYNLRARILSEFYIMQFSMLSSTKAALVVLYWIRYAQYCWQNMIEALKALYGLERLGSIGSTSGTGLTSRALLRSR